MNLPISTNQNLTMSSREIAELLGKQHSNIKISAERLAEKGTIALQGSKFEHNGNWYNEWLLNKRDSLILVAQNSPEFTAAIVDRWQELESQQVPTLPTSFAEALQLAADQAKQIELAAPKVEFHDTVVQSDHTYKFQEAGKKIQQRPNKFVKWLRDNGYLMKNNIPYQQYVDLGVMIIHTGINGEGFEFTQGRITTKGLAYFTKKLDGVTL